MSVKITKDGATDLVGVEKLEIELQFEQTSGGGGLFARARNKINPADPDLFGLALVDRRPVDYVEPKGRAVTLNGALAHDGDGRGAGTEVVRVDLARMAAEDSDIDGLAFAAVIGGEEGFSRIAGAVVRVFDTTSGARVHLGNVRPEITSRNTCVVVGTLARDAGGTWSFKVGTRKGYAADWKAAAGLAAGDLYR